MAPTQALDSSTWWKVTRTGGKKKPTRGATPLLERCMKAYGWTEEYARRVLAGYRQFLELKCTMEDWDGTALTPSSPIRKMWLHHVADTKHYQEDCQTLCGGGSVVHYDPDAVLMDSKAVASRIHATKVGLKVKFGMDEVDSEIWCFEETSSGGATPAKVRGTTRNAAEDESKPEARASKRTKKATAQPFSSPAPQAASLASPINTMTISLKDWQNESSYFKVISTAQVRNLKSTYAKFRGMDEDNLIFFFEGCPLPEDAMVASLGIKDGSEIEVSLETQPLENVFDSVDVLEM